MTHPLEVLRRAGLKVGLSLDGAEIALGNIRSLAPERRGKMFDYVSQHYDEILDGVRRGLRIGLPCDGWEPDDPAIGGYTSMKRLQEAMNDGGDGLLLCPIGGGSWTYSRTCPDVGCEVWRRAREAAA